MKFRYCVSVFLALLSIGFLTPVFVFAANVPVRVSSVPTFVFDDDDFAAAMVMDVTTKKVLFSYQPDKKWTAASLTKLMGALVFLDSQPSWNAIVSLKEEDEVGGGRLRVEPTDTMTIEDLMYSSITGSANNAATAFARLSGLGMTRFVQAMNTKARALGCTSSVFTDPSGMDVGNTITANDVLKIATAAFSRPSIQRPASTAYYSFVLRNSGVKKTIKSTDDLLLDPNNGLYVTGGKTGYLYESLNNFVYRVRPSKDDATHELIVVVLGSPSRTDLFATAEKLTKWAWRAYNWDASAPDTAADVAVQAIPNGTLVKKATQSTVWYVWKGKKYVLLDGVFLDHYFPNDPIEVVDGATIDAMPSPRPYTFDDGELVKSPGDPTVYFVQYGLLRAIADEKTFLAMGMKWADIITAPPFVLQTYSRGLAIHTGNTSSVSLSIGR